MGIVLNRNGRADGVRIKIMIDFVCAKLTVASSTRKTFLYTTLMCLRDYTARYIQLAICVNCEHSNQLFHSHCAKMRALTLVGRPFLRWPTESSYYQETKRVTHTHTRQSAETLVFMM